MQPITIEPISIVAIIIIVVTLVYSYFKYNSADKKEVVLTEKISAVAAAENQSELPVITALIAMLMEQRPFKIKNIVVGKGEELSTWRQSGRQEIMRRRANMQR
jgi:hypothetical protein